MAFNHRKTVTHSLAQAARASRSHSAAHLSRLGLHPGQEHVLKALGQKDGQSMSQLASALQVQPPTVTKMVGRLAAQGYVERRSSEDDARQAYVYLTEQGSETIAAIDKAWKRMERNALAGIDDKDRKRLKKLLKQIQENLAANRERGKREGPVAAALEDLEVVSTAD